MKKLLFGIVLIISSAQIYAQVDVMAGMGITFQSNPSLKDYIDNLTPGGEGLAQFSSAVNFFGEIDYSINPTFDLGLEYEYKLSSYNTAFGGAGNYDLSYVTHSPSLLAYYVVQGVGYKFKFGGGAGYRIVAVDEELPTSNTVTNFTANGFGMLLKAQANTLLGGDFYASIGADIRYDIIGEATDGNQTFGSTALKEKIDFNTIAFSVKVGISYFIR